MPTDSRMFLSITRTVNPVIGCCHECSYCYARDLAEGRLKHQPKYKDGFAPAFFPEVLKTKCRPGEFIFVSSMGDLFGEWVPAEWISDVLAWAGRYPATNFLLQTKNPGRFLEFGIPANAYLGTTIESDIDYQLSNAPPPHLRYDSMLQITPFARTFLSIEPIMDFNLGTLCQWVHTIRPDIIEIGADNHHKNLTEPPVMKVTALLKLLHSMGLNVIEKPGLERLCR